MKIETSKLLEHPLNKDLFDALPKGEYAALKKDIEANGIKTELHLLPDYTVLCGHQRMKVARELGFEYVPAKIVSLTTPEAIEEYIITDNLLRRHLKPEQRAPLLLRLDRLVEKHIGQGKRTDLKPSAQNEQKVDRWQEIARRSGDTPQTARRLVQYAREIEARPDLKGQKVTKVLRDIKRGKQEEIIKNLKPIDGKFNVIVVDPPWQYGGYEPDGLRGKGDYPVRSVEEIRALKLPAADDCILWLWGVDLLLKETLEIIEAWGFERKKEGWGLTNKGVYIAMVHCNSAENAFEDKPTLFQITERFQKRIIQNPLKRYEQRLASTNGLYHTAFFIVPKVDLKNVDNDAYWYSEQKRL